MLDERPYPRELYWDWQQLTERADLTPHDAECVMRIVRYAQPPLCSTALQTASLFYQLDKNKQELEKIVTALPARGLLETQLPKNLGTFYPVFFAISNKRFLGRPSCRIANLGRRLISKWFSELPTERKTSRSNFYTHLLAVRHVLMSVIEAGYETAEDYATPEEFFRAAIESDKLYSRRLLIQTAYDTFIDISAGKLSPGELIRKSPHVVKGGTREQGKKTDPWHYERMKQLVATLPPQRRLASIDDTPTESEKYNTPVDVNPPCGLRQVAPPAAPKDDDESSEPPVLKRQTASALTPEDDRRLVQQWIAAAATVSLATVGDMARLTPEQVREALSAPLSPLERTFAVLLLSTGLPVKRLLTMTVCSAGAVALTSEPENRPLWYSASGELCYQLLDGPSASADPEMRWIRLRLPAKLAGVLSAHEYSTPGSRPFRGIRGRLNRRLARHFRHQPGITPTANRISATSWLWRRPHARDDVAAATLAGQFGLALAAPAAYRQLARQEIQRVFDDTLESLGLKTVLDHDDTNSQAGSLLRLCSVMGSAVAQPPQVFTAIFTELRDAMAGPADEVASWWVGQAFPTGSLASLYQLVAAYHLLAWQLSTGARPIGPSSQNRLAEQVQWIRDKSSARGIESRVVPLLSEIQKALAHLERWTDIICYRLREQGQVFEDQRSSQLSTPAWLVAPQRGRRWVLRDMTWSDLQSLSLRKTTGLASNVTRHSLASWLRERASDAEVDALLGHARDGRSLSAPRATAPIGTQPALRRLLSEWLRQCGYRPLRWEILPWSS
ncbi:hypothetical protein [Litchfieldella xinjiangensis]|uniref:hypothetical protein n=1 Tax=Litchfieldella xinjiangensis TaxID=1166948 RepID=UPI0005BE05B3|nr:hypothetical protein [Halomonas xinjiangensis]